MNWHGVIVGAALMAAPALAQAEDAPAASPPAPAAAVAGPAPVLRLLSYNVEGLPWPFAVRRRRDEQRIGALLRAMRRAGDAPGVVVAQEAFRGSARAIGAAGGYAYVAYGAGHAMAGAAPATAADRAFAAAGSRWHGEGVGKHIGSGLAIFSDYPILWTRRQPFPAYACAGWDCLANKGMLAAAIALPGVARPVVVIDTHLNARRAAGVDPARSLYAYRRQVDALGAFVASVAPSSGGVLLAGDFNVGHDPGRRAYLAQVLAADGLTIAAKEDSCGGTCRRLDPSAAPADVDGAKTILAYAGSAPRPAGPASSFGTTKRDRRLSDHIGVERGFTLG